MYRLTQFINAQMLWVTLGITAIFVSFLSEMAALTAVVVFGQAHFFISYFYTHKGGKMTAKYLKKFFATIFLVFACALYVFTHPQYFNLWIYITMMAFVVHYFFDEYKLQATEAVVSKYIAVSGLLVLYGYVFGVKLFDTQLSMPVLVSFFSVTVAAVMVWYSRQRSPRSFLLQTVIFFLLHISFLLVASISSEINEYHISALIVLHHYIRWYVYYYDIFSKHDHVGLERYIDVILLFHLFVFVLYYQYTLNPSAGFVQFLFNPVFFYAWTLVHIYMSVRPSDYRLL
jgi:hypothetical protein